MDRADKFISSPLASMLSLTTSDVLAIFKIYRTTYYNWKNNVQSEDGRKNRLAQEDLRVKRNMLEIIECLGYVPGSRTFYTYLIRDYGMRISILRCRRLMEEMHLKPKNGRIPSKRASKKKGTHCHPCAAVENLVLQNFYQEPRKIVLTDITYLYINEFHNVIYLCVFYDCFTKEALGWSLRKDMTTALVEGAYNMMMLKHGDELRGAKVVIHSDQGSQYTSTTFKQLLRDEGFLQSMSERGNSQDNAPMESFFGRMKERILNLIATCQNFDTAKRLLYGYLNDYNMKHYQFSLAGLTPIEFYEYTQTGIYPLDTYFGVKVSELGEQRRLIDARIAKARKRNADERETYKEKREQEQCYLKLPPRLLVLRDQSILKRRLRIHEHKKARTEEKIVELKSILDKTKVALAYLEHAGQHILRELCDPFQWRRYPELAYVHDMNGMY